MEEVVRWFGEGGHAGNVTRKDLRYGRWMYHHHVWGMETPRGRMD